MTILRTALALVVGVSVVLVATASIVSGGGVDAVAFAGAQVLAFGGVGAFLVSRFPRNPIGWLLTWSGVNFGLGYSADQFARWAFARGDHDLAAWLSWFESWGFLLGMPLVLVLLPLWFPDGQPPTPRWRWVAWTAIAGVGLAIVGQATRPAAMLVDLPNPIGQPLPPALSEASFALGTGLTLLALLGGIGALALRFRRSTGIERQQVKWLLAVVAIAAMVFIALAPVALVVDTPAASDIALVGIGLGMLAIPVGVAVAILRYRLYEIDRFVARTVSYGLVTTVLVGVYALIAVVPAALFDLESDLLVAGATLVAAAAFGPVRRRVQGGVDRRFNRSRYDATRVADRFAIRLRDEVDLDDLVGDLRGVVADTVQPTSVSLWLRGDA